MLMTSMKIGWSAPTSSACLFKQVKSGKPRVSWRLRELNLEALINF
jgi:hypothetical protein